MSKREENYAKHLQSLSDDELNLLLSEYDYTIITKLTTVSNTINNYRQEKLDDLYNTISEQINK
jgi:hypothetical protein